MTRDNSILILERLDWIQREIVEMKADHKLNTEFRLQAKGIIGTVSFISTIFGALLIWALQKIIR
jgi:hypothetical protein